MALPMPARGQVVRLMSELEVRNRIGVTRQRMKRLKAAGAWPTPMPLRGKGRPLYSISVVETFVTALEDRLARDVAVQAEAAHRDERSV